MKRFLLLVNIFGLFSFICLNSCSKKSHPNSNSKMETKSENSSMNNTNSTQTTSQKDKPSSSGKGSDISEDSTKVFKHSAPDQERIDSIKNENFKAKKKK